jgi:hypothetical protein
MHEATNKEPSIHVLPTNQQNQHSSFAAAAYKIRCPLKAAETAVPLVLRSGAASTSLLILHMVL